MSELAYTIEGILFYESESVSLLDLCELSGKGRDEVLKAIQELSEAYAPGRRNIVLLENNDSYQLTVSGAARDLILARDAKEREGELSRSALETLSAVLYLGQATKSQIDYIRGVQSSYMLRILVSRGLLARAGKIGRDTVYTSTVETLRFMGLAKVEDLPDFESISAEFKRALNTIENKE